MKAIKTTPNKTKLSDAEVIHRILNNGEKELYELLMRRNNQKLYRVVRSYVKATNEVEDIMQNTYLKAYEKLHQFKRTSGFSTWLIKIGINEALTTIKERGKIRSIEFTPGHVDANSETIMRKQHRSTPEGIILQQETRHFIEKAIDMLDSKYKVVFIMKEVEGMSIQEIASCLDLTPSNVKVRLHRAKNMLKETLFELHLNKGVFEYGFSRCDNLVRNVMYEIEKK